MDYTLEIASDGDNAPCAVCITAHPSMTIVLDETFPNAKIASANIRDHLGFSIARDLMAKLHISPNSDLYSFNFERPFPKMPPVVVTDSEVLAKIPEGFRCIDKNGWCNWDEGETSYLCENPSTMQLGVVTTGEMCMGSGPYIEWEPCGIADWHALCVRNSERDGLE